MNFITKDTGERASFSGGMVRDSEATKTRWDLIPNELFDRVMDDGKNTNFIQAFRYWQETGDGAADVIRVLIQLDCAGDTLEFFKRVADLMARGAEKYDEWNWQKGKDGVVYERYFRSADRHFKQYLLGDRTEDHAVAIYFNLNGRIYVANQIAKESDDFQLEP